MKKKYNKISQALLLLNPFYYLFKGLYIMESGFSYVLFAK